MLRSTLENGLQVLVEPTDAAPLVAIWLWLEAGTSDETPTQVGAAHFLEHMLFKGTSARAVGVAAAEIEGLGGDLNAFTDHDETVIHATVEASAAAEALDVLADMVRQGALAADELERERDVILEEIRGYDDDPESVLDDALQARLFGDHPYGRPVLGTVSSVAKLDMAALSAFRAANHGADRAILAIAGQVDPEATEAAAKRLFSAWARAGAARSLAPAPAPRRDVLVERIARPFETTRVALGWRCPALTDPDAAALEILAMAVGEGASSLLATRLMLDDELATDTWSDLLLRRAAGSLSFGFVPREDRTVAAVNAAMEALAHVAARGVASLDIERAQRGILADGLFARETVDGIAEDLAHHTARYGDPDARERYRRAIAAVTADDVRRVARGVLDPSRVTALVLDPQATQARLEKAVGQRTLRVAVSRPEPIREVLANGATLWVLPDTSPVVAIHAVGLGGGLLETEKLSGMAEAWARLAGVAAADLDASAMADAQDDAASVVEGFAERSLMGMRASFPAGNADSALDLFGSALAKPRFDRDDVSRIRDELRDQLRTSPDHPEERADNLLWAGLYPNHPWRLPPLGTETSLEKVTSGALTKFHAANFTPDNLVIAVAGGIDADLVHETLGPWLEELPKGPWKPPEWPIPGPVAPGIYRARAGHGQAHIWVGVRGPAAHDPDRAALQIAAAVLNGQGGRLFVALRERLGLAYDVWSESVSTFGGGAFIAGIASDPARVEAARQALIDEFDRLVDEPPNEDEVQRYRRMLMGRAAMGLQRASGRAADRATHERLGLRPGLDAWRATLQNVAVADVAAAVERYMAAPRVIVVVEPAT